MSRSQHSHKFTVVTRITSTKLTDHTIENKQWFQLISIIGKTSKIERKVQVLFIVGCDMLCDMLFFRHWSPVCKEAFFRLESRALNIRDRCLSFCYFFLVLSQYLFPLVVCNLNIEIFFGQWIIITMVALKYHYKNYLPLVTAISRYGRGTKIFFQAHLFELGNLQDTGLTEHRPASN